MTLNIFHVIIGHLYIVKEKSIQILYLFLNYVVCDRWQIHFVVSI